MVNTCDVSIVKLETSVGTAMVLIFVFMVDKKGFAVSVEGEVFVSTTGVWKIVKSVMEAGYASITGRATYVRNVMVVVSVVIIGRGAYVKSVMVEVFVVTIDQEVGAKIAKEGRSANITRLGVCVETAAVEEFVCMVEIRVDV